jgi:hypothetical protein
LLRRDRKACGIKGACLFICSLVSAACGYVGDPLPPLVQIPTKVSDLVGIQIGRAVRLSWTLPQLNTDGSAATTLSRMEVYRLREKANSVSNLEITRFVPSARKWIVLDKVNFDAYTEGGSIALQDHLENLDTEEILQSLFTYGVKALNSKKQDSGFSNLISVRIHLVPNPPTAIHFSFEEHAIKLSWQASALNIDGSPVETTLKYNVYRATTTAARVRERLTATAVDGTDYRDTTMALGQNYYYAVRAVVDSPDGPIESSDSTEYEAKNVDTYPPRPPTEVTAVSNGESISLVWSPNAEDDLAGYYVYRSGIDRDFKKLTPLISTASFEDTDVEKGKTYFYRVRALDKVGNESDNSKEVSEKVE